LPIISSFVLAQALLKRSEGTIEGFVIEGAIAGGHNAPPRGPLVLNELGEPVYGEKDVVDLEKMKQLGLPFWLAGGYGNHDQLQKALDAGAAGIQVGTAFAFCEESGMAPMLKHSVLSRILNADGADPVRVFTSPVASPTGFPFKVVLQQGTLSELSVYEQRSRICDLSFLRTIYKRPDGEIGYRCPAEPIKDYVRKGGTVEDTVGTTCLCNNLAATAGFGQSRILDNGSMYVEPPTITSGDDLPKVGQHVRVGKTSYTAQDVIECLQNSKLEEVSGTVNTQLPEPG
jgi:nitronate monooxygenase